MSLPSEVPSRVVSFDELTALIAAQDHLRGVRIAFGGAKTWSPVWAATVSACEDLVEELLSETSASFNCCRAQIDELDPESGCCPLHCAAKLTLHSAIGALVQAGANVNSQNSDMFGLGAGGIRLLPECGGKTALHILCCHKENDRVRQSCKLLLDARADVSLKDTLGFTAHDLACAYGNKELSAVLLAFGATASASTHDKAELVRMCRAREEQWELEQKIARRSTRQKMMQEIGSSYIPKRPHLFTPDFLTSSCDLDTCTGSGDATGKVDELSPGVFCMRGVFCQQSCDALLEELDAFSVWATETGFQVARPNSMNRYGMVVNDIGFQASMHALMESVVQPLAARLFPRLFKSDDGAPKTFASQHSFIVRYKAGEDINLKTHQDDSDITLNLCLGRVFEGADVYFHAAPSIDESHTLGNEYADPHTSDCSSCTLKHRHIPGTALLHLGRHVHGVDSLHSGERVNLIMWCRFRPYPQEMEEPFPLPQFQVKP